MPETTTLPNGLRIIHYQVPQAGSCAIAVFVGAGARYEQPETNGGVTHFLEHLLFRGTKKYPRPKQAASKIEAIGGYINAYTTEDRTCFEVKLPRQHWQLGLEVLYEMTMQSLVSATAVEKERGAVLEEINMYRDDPARNVFELVGQLLWPTDSMGNNVLGKEQIISSIKRADVYRYYKTHYTVSNLVIAVAGNLENSEVVSKISELFRATSKQSILPPQPTKGPLSRRRSVIQSHDTNQSHVLVLARTPGYNHRDEAPLRVLATILGGSFTSRLYTALREQRALAYNLFASTSSYSDTGALEMYAGLNRGKVTEALRVLAAELAKLRAKPVTGHELRAAQELMKGQLQMYLENTANIADWLGVQQLIGGRIWSIEQSLAKIDSVTPADISRVAKRYLAPNKLRLAMIGPHSQRDQSKFETILSK